MAIDHWCRKVMNDAVVDIVRQQVPGRLSTLEVSGDAWSNFGFDRYKSVSYPGFDICRDVLDEKFDLIIAEQVFEHLYDPDKAARNIRRMLKPSGLFLITLPFLIKYHPMPQDYRRWTQHGLKAFLDINGFTDIQTASWGNRECLIANLDEWVVFDETMHSLHNDPSFPVVAWGVARRKDKAGGLFNFLRHKR